MLAAGLVLFVVGAALRSPSLELSPSVFGFIFFVWMALITWGVALILRPWVQSLLRSTLDGR
jgi:hypothetical protein